MNLVEKDLMHHIDDKLNRWTRDSMAVFDMAEIDKKDATACIIHVLLRNLCAALVAHGATNEDAYQVVCEQLVKAREARERVIARKAKLIRLG
jgi:hypothetical protein